MSEWIRKSGAERVARLVDWAWDHHGGDHGPGMPVIALLETRRHDRPLRLITTLRLRDGTPVRRLLRP